jgi:hypothetical protein
VRNDRFVQHAFREQLRWLELEALSRRCSELHQVRMKLGNTGFSDPRQRV